MTLLSALGGGLWVIPLGFLLGSIWSFYRAIKSHTSGSWYWGKDENGVAKKFESDENVPYTGIGAFWFGVGLLVLAVGSFIWMQLEK